MTTHQDSWLNKAHRWFDVRPEREFRLAMVPIAELPTVASAGVIAGCASAPCKPGIPIAPLVQPGAKHLPCILRRADSVSGRPLLGVYLLDGAAPPPPPCPSAGAEEQFCEAIWRMAQHAESAGVSLVALMTDPVMLESAAGVMPPPRRR